MAKRATMTEMIPIKGQAALPERPVSAPARPQTVPLTFRAPVAMHDRLRKLAYDTRVPIQKIIEDAVSHHLDTKGVMVS